MIRCLLKKSCGILALSYAYHDSYFKPTANVSVNLDFNKENHYEYIFIESYPWNYIFRTMLLFTMYFSCQWTIIMQTIS